MATSSVSVRFNSGLSGSSSGNLLFPPSDDEYGNSILPHSISNGGGALMMVDTSTSSLLNSIPSNIVDYEAEDRKIQCLQSHQGGNFQPPGSFGNFNKNDYDEKYGFQSQMSVDELCVKPVSKLKQEKERMMNDIIVSTNDSQNDVTLEYVDLDEFLHENGLSNVCKATDPPSASVPNNNNNNNNMERHYLVSLQHRGLGAVDSTTNSSIVQNSLPQDIMGSTTTTGSNNNNNINGGNSNNVPPPPPPQHHHHHHPPHPSSLAVVVPIIGESNRGLPQNRVNMDLYSEPNKQRSPCSPNSMASPSSSTCSIDLGVNGGRSRRRSSTKSIDSGRSLSPNEDEILSGKNGLEPRVIKRSKKEMVPDVKKDANYWKKREKNNLAAKRSRDSRRQREAQISYKTKLLESENASLNEKLERFQRQNEELKQRLRQYEAV